MPRKLKISVCPSDTEIKNLNFAKNGCLRIADSKMNLLIPNIDMFSQHYPSFLHFKKFLTFFNIEGTSLS